MTEAVLAIAEEVQDDDEVAMTADHMAEDLLGALLDEMKILEDPWQKLTHDKQNDVIDRLRMRVKHNVIQAVSIISNHDFPHCEAEVEQVVFKDGVKAVLQLPKHNNHVHELADRTSMRVMVVIADPELFYGSIDDVEGDPDQADMIGEDAKVVASED